jgi:uncharacterized protein YndB with AHSA1/START domain
MTTVIRTHQILVHAPLQSAFEYVSDLTRHPEWNGGLRIEPVTSGPIAVGKEYTSRGEVAVQKDRPNTVRVAQYQPPQQFGFVSHDPDFGDVSHVFTFTEQTGGVLITRQMTVNLPPLVALGFRFLIYPLIGRPSMDKAMAGLKKKLETREF